MSTMQDPQIPDTRMTATLSVALRQDQYAALIERAWRSRARVGEFVRDLLDEAGVLAMPEPDEEGTAKRTKKTGGAR